jgi:Flp pilus assembly protein TadB
VPLPQALAQFAADFDDDSIDMVCGALILNARLRGPGLVNTLTALSSSVREELDMARRIEQERKNLRAEARTILLAAATFAGWLVLFNRSYLEPYSSLTGQLVLLLVVGIFVAGLGWMRQLANFRGHERFLVGPDTLVARINTGEQVKL